MNALIDLRPSMRTTNTRSPRDTRSTSCPTREAAQATAAAPPRTSRPSAWTAIWRSSPRQPAPGANHRVQAPFHAAGGGATHF